MPYADLEVRRQKAREYVRLYRERHPGRISAYKEKTKHKAAGYTAAYRKCHPEKIKAAALKRTRIPMTPEKLKQKALQSKNKYASDPAYKIAQLARTRKNHLLRRYGITEEERDALARKQKHKCGVCRKETKLYIDHCHTKKKVRGLLCHKCNVVLGMAEDNPKILLAAISYLRGNNKEKK